MGDKTQPKHLNIDPEHNLDWKKKKNLQILFVLYYADFKGQVLRTKTN